MPIIIALVILLGGGASFAAQSSLPGNSLYPIKVHVNEEVRSWVAISDEAQANLDAKIATLRLEEAEKLAARAELDAKAKAQIEANFEEHADKVQARMEVFAEERPQVAAEVMSNFETSLKAHDRILSTIGQAEVKSRPLIQSLLVKVNAEAQDSAEIKADQEAKVSAQAQVNVQAAAEGRLGATENKIAEVEKFLDNKGDEFDAEFVASAKARLAVAEDLVVQGKAKLEAKMYGEAFRLFQKAHAVAQEAKLIIRANSEFDGRVEKRPTASPSPSSSVSPSPTPTSTTSGNVEGNVETNNSVNSDQGSVRSDGRMHIRIGF